jgi:predicted ATP-dependent protease
MIPAANVRNLILRADVVEAAAERRFHIYPVRTIDQGLEILTGVRAGEAGEEATVNHAVTSRLKELALGLKEFGGGDRAQPGNGSPAF